MVAFCSSIAEGNECNELRKRYLIPKAISPKIFEQRPKPPPHVGFYINMKVMIGRVSFHGVRDSSRQ